MAKRAIFTFLIFCYLLNVICYLTVPFVGPYGHSHLQYSVAARNYLESGWQKFIPYVYPTQKYLNHPTLLYIFLSIFYKVFGFHDWVGRLMPFLFSLGSALFFYLIIKKHFSKKIANYSLIFYLTFPMFLFYGAFIQFEPLVLFFCLGGFYFLDKYLSSKSLVLGPKFIVLSSLFLVLSFLSDFSGLIFAGLLIVYLFFIKRRVLACYYLLNVICYLLFYYWYFRWINFPLSSLLSVYFSRATLTEIFNIGFILRFISVIFLRFLIYFSPLIIIFSFPMLHTSYFILQLKNQKKLWIFILLLLFPLINVFLLPGGTLTHPYFLFFFIPIMALLCGYLMSLRGRASSGPKQSLIRLLRRFAPRNDTVIMVLLLTHFISSIIIFSLKIYQIKKFSWQYEVTQKTAGVIGKDKVFYKNWALDKELFYWYGKKLSLEIYPPELLNKIAKLRQTKGETTPNYYLFVCFPRCQQSDQKFLIDLSKKFTWQKINVEIPSYIFNLKGEPKKEKLIVVKEEIKTDKYLEFLRKIKGFFNVDQL